MATIGSCALVLLVACGGSTAVTSDAPSLPPPIDAIAPGPATLAITNAGAPVPGVQVWFQAADMSVIAETMTDATGAASAVIASDAIVTVLDPFGAAGDLRSYMGVQPGDRLTLDQPDVSAQIVMTILAPVDPDAGTYVAVSTCGSTALVPAAPATVAGSLSLAGCHGVTDLLIESSFLETGAPSGTLYVPDVTLVDGGTIDLTAMSYTPLQIATFTYTYPNQSFFLSLACDQVAGAHGALLQSCSPDGAETTGGTVYAVEVPAAAGATFIIDTAGSGFQDSSGSPFSRQDIFDWGPFSQSYLLDTGAAALPEFVAPPTLDFANRRIPWSETVAGSVPDLAVGFIAGESFTWEIAAPYRSGTLELPVLPIDAPMPIQPALAMLLLAEVPGGYDAARPTVLSTLYLSGQRANPHHFITGPSGHAAVTQWTVE